MVGYLTQLRAVSFVTGLGVAGGLYLSTRVRLEDREACACLFGSGAQLGARTRRAHPHAAPTLASLPCPAAAPMALDGGRG